MTAAAAMETLLFFWDYDTQWGADRTRRSTTPARWGHLEFPCTDELLDLHAAFDIPACFAIVGAAALPGERPYHDPAQIRRIHAAGHEVASHALRHEWLPALDAAALRRTLRESKDALEQCIGAPVVTFVPPFNQPFDYAGGWSFSLAERREAGRRRTTVRRLCEALRETGYRFCRLAYSPIGERIAAWWHGRIDLTPGLGPSSSASASFDTGPTTSSGHSGGGRDRETPGGDAASGAIADLAAMRLRSRPRSRPLVDIAGITCVRVSACGFDAQRLDALRRPGSARGPIVFYGHPHSLHGADASQSATALRATLLAARGLSGIGVARCVRPRDLLAESTSFPASRPWAS